MIAAAGTPEPFTLSFPWVFLLLLVLLAVLWALRPHPRRLATEGDEP